MNKAILLLLTTSSAASIKDTQLKSIGEIVRERPGLIQIMSDVNQWDGDILGLVDSSYTTETATATQEQKVDVEFQLSEEEQTKRDSEHEVKEKEEAEKKREVVQAKIIKNLAQQKEKLEQQIKIEKEQAEKREKLEQLEKKKRQALAELQKAKEAKEKQVAKKKKVIDEEWNNFCQTLRMDHWYKAMELWAKLDKSGYPQPILKVNTKELFQKNFKFDSIANNADTQTVLQDLDIAQINLN